MEIAEAISKLTRRTVNLLLNSGLDKLDVWRRFASDLAFEEILEPFGKRRIQGAILQTVGTFVGTAPTAWHIFIHLRTSGDKSISD